MRIEDMKSSFRKKKSISIVVVLLFFTFLFVNQITAKAGTGIVYGENGIITRAEWLHDLALIFEMSVEDENYPDNYFSDLSGESEYYYDVLLTVQFGLIDVEAGGEIAPNEVVTREFAAHTLNFCLGYQLEESESYTFDDADNCSYPADAQVALNREWFAAVNGMFSPEAEVTAGEVRKMIEDAQVVMQEMTVDEEYENQYEFADADVKEIPQGILVEKDEDTLRITDCPISLKSGDKFVVYFDGLPGAYVAGDVSTEGNITSVQVTQSDAENIFEDIDAQGVVDVDLSQAEAEEDAEITYIDESADKNSKERAVPRAVRQISRSLSVLKKVNLGRGLTAEVALKMKNPKIEYKINLGKREAYAKLMGDTEITYKIKGDSAVAAGLGKIPMIKATVPGVGGFSMNLELEASGAITGIQKGYLTAGIGYSDAGGFRIIKGFQTQAFTLTVEATVSAGIQAQFGITDVPGNILRAYVYAKAGGRAVLKSSTFSDGNLPGRCTHYAAYIYAEYGAEAGVNFGFYKRSISLNETIYNENNSPIRVVKHYEDGRQVARCTRGLKWGSSYYTRWNSRYGGSGWYGGNGLYGLDETGNPVEIYTYTVDDEGNATITGYRGNVAALTVPDEIDGHTVVAIGNGAFEGNKSVKSMVLPDTVTSIKSSAFAGSVLSSMVLPPNVTELGDLILDGNTGVEEISIPRTVSIHGWNGNGVFEGSGIRKAVFERGMTEIPVEIMKGSLYLNEVSIPDSVTSIGARAFEDCESLKQIKLPDSVTSIENLAFAGSGLSSMVLPPNVTELGDLILDGNTGVEEISIPRTVSIHGWNGKGVFEGSGIRKAVFERGMTEIPVEIMKGSLYLNEVSIPDSVTSIGARAFEDCESLKQIKLPDSVTSIENLAFAGSGLSSMVLPPNVTELGDLILDGNTGVEEISIPRTVSIHGWNGKGVFEGSGIRKAVFERGMTEIPVEIMKGSLYLNEVSIPDSVTSIGARAFEDCESLKQIQLLDSIISIDENAFRNCGLTSIKIPNSTADIGIYIFSNCRSLEEVILPERLQNIPRSMCEGCIALTRIAMPETVKSVGQSAFKDCTTLETIKWSKNTKTIQREVFKNCSALKSFQIPDVVISIENNAFSNCDALESIRIPDTVTSIGYGLFEDCDALREVSLGVGLTSIPDSCFEHCDALESLILPYRIKSIGENAFKNSVKFTSITIPRATTSIPSTAFSYPAKMTVYGVPGTYAETFATEQNIRFVAKEIKAAAALLNQKVITLNRGDTARLALSVEPADFTDEVSWKCTDTDIATVDDGGVVTASGVGNATIKVTVGDVSASCAVIVQEPVSGIWLNATQLTLEALDTYQMEANIWPEDAYNKEIEWLTSNAEIASVDNAGLITAQKKGTAIITAKAKDGSDVSAACEVTVSNTVYWVSSVEELESPHNYLNECSDFWIYTLPRKADSLDVRFDERTEVEENFDFLYIYGGDGAEMGRYTGKELAGKTIAVPGNILKIKLVSDNAGNTWGFKVASITVDGEEQDEPEEPVQPGNPGGISAPERPELPIVKPPVQAVVSRPPSVGMKVTDPVSKAVYKVTGAAYAEYSESSDKKMSNVKIPDKVTLAGKSYKVTTVASEAFKNCKKLKSVVIGKGVTAIGAKAFFGCKSLKKITIKSTQLRKVGKKAFKRIHAKAVIKVPKAKLKAYKKLLKKKGQGKKVRILK